MLARTETIFRNLPLRRQLVVLAVVPTAAALSLAAVPRERNLAADFVHVLQDLEIQARP